MNNQLLSRVRSVLRSFRLFARLLQINAFARANWCGKPLSPAALVPTLPLACEPWSACRATNLVASRGVVLLHKMEPCYYCYL